MSRHLVGFLTGILQNHSRKYKIAIDQLRFRYEVASKPHSPPPANDTDQSADDIADKVEDDGRPENGIGVYGMFIEGARWCYETQRVHDSLPAKMFMVSDRKRVCSL